MRECLLMAVDCNCELGILSPSQPHTHCQLDFKRVPVLLTCWCVQVKPTLHHGDPGPKTGWLGLRFAQYKYGDGAVSREYTQSADSGLRRQ